MRSKKYHIDLWNVTIEYCLGWSHDEISKHTKKQFKNTDDLTSYEGFHQVYNDKKGGLVSLIYVKSKNRKEQMGVLVHEAVHSAMRILTHRNVKFDDNNQEVLAYLVELIFKKGLG